MNMAHNKGRPNGVRKIDLRGLAEYHATGFDLPNKSAETQRLFRLVLNEAEALAISTGVPELVLPALAEEKISALQQWSARQRMLRSRSHAWTLADQRN